MNRNTESPARRRSVAAVKRAMLGTPDPNNPISRGVQFAAEVAGVTAVALEPQPACRRTGIHMVPVGHQKCQLCGEVLPDGFCDVDGCESAPVAGSNKCDYHAKLLRKNKETADDK